MVTISLHQAGPDDADHLAHVHLATATLAYASIVPPEAPPPALESIIAEWQGGFDDPSFRAFLAEERALPVGVVAIRADPDFADCGQLQRLYVLPGYWNTGVGSALHETAVSALRDGTFRQAGLWVLEANDRARRFYEKRGWRLLPEATLTWPGLRVVEVRYSRTLARS